MSATAESDIPREEDRAKQAEMWAREEALSDEERRARYRCGDRFVTLGDLAPTRWSVLGAQFQRVADRKYKANAAINNKIAHYAGDITVLEVDAILNAANNRGLGGGGIDGAIHSGAGDDLYDECVLLRGIETGTTKVTRGYRLPAKFVAHTVGPVGEDEERLRSSYATALRSAVAHGWRSLALCGVSTGVYGYPLRQASKVACDEVRKWLEVPEHAQQIDCIIFVSFLKKEINMYNYRLAQFFPIDDEDPPATEEEEEEEKEQVLEKDVIEVEQEKEEDVVVKAPPHSVEINTQHEVYDQSEVAGMGRGRASNDATIDIEMNSANVEKDAKRLKPTDAE